MRERWLVATVAVLTALTAISRCQDAPPLEWIPMSDNQVILPPGDDTSTEVITPIGFSFGGSIQHQIYVMINGLISFGSPYPTFFNQPFPGPDTLLLIAPFWDDVNTNDGGTISYEIHTSGDSLQLVSGYVSSQIGEVYEGYWMMVIFWDQVPPFSFFTAASEVNSFQAILIMDQNQNTYAIFIYECGLMGWDSGATIGFSAGPDHFDNHDPSSSAVACVNQSVSSFSNVFYQLHEAEPLPTAPAQASYLDFFPHTTTTISSGFLEGCDDCNSAEILLPGDFPFGNYYHQSAYVASNGHVSFRIDYTHFNPELFPTTNPNIYWDFVSAPFWSDVDLRLEGSASWEIHTVAQSQEMIDSVSLFIRENYDSAGDFSGDWMMIVYWEDVHPWPHGVGIETPYTLSSNTFQAVLITNGEKSYAVYTYRCGEMEWGDESTIGYNAGADYYENHELTGHFQSHFIACLQNTSSGNLITNQIYDLVPDPSSLLPGAIPPFHTTIGSCADAGFTECCTEGDCRGLPFVGSCYCDGLCEDRGDCCYDQQLICPTGLLTDDYLIVADDVTILHMSLNGSDIQILNSDVNGRAYGIDYHLVDGIMIWSDVERNVIYQKNLDGTGLVTELVTTNIAAVDDVAIDWVGNNLYWTDAVWARIEVMNLDTRDRAEVLRTGTNTNPRAIVVDPTTRFMYWTELGENVQIERASMDGEPRQVIFGFDLIQPDGLAIDIAEQRLYWCDTVLGTIAYAVVGPQGLVDLAQLTLDDGTIVQPFALTLSGTSVFWTDWSTNEIYSTHKLHGDSENIGHLFTVYTSISGTPRGLEVVSSNQQPTDILNPCDGSGCSHICMLSAVVTGAGFTCACPGNYELGSNGLDCEMVSTPEPTAPLEGSCTDAGYTACCSHGSCGGTPATCFCDEACYERFDCCSDTPIICNEVPPVPATNIELTFGIRTATITFTISFVVYDSEEYVIYYGVNEIELEQSSEVLNSVDVADQQYTIVINGLLPGTTYFFQLASTNSISTTLSGLVSGTTLETAPSGAPQNFFIGANGSSLMVSWDPPLPEDSNGVITSYLLACDSEDADNFELLLNPIFLIILYDLAPFTEYACSIAASTSAGIGPYSEPVSATITLLGSELLVLQWIPMDVLFGTIETFLPATDDGFEGPIEISTGFPFGSSIQTQVFVGTNGLLSFGSGYNSFISQVFPGSIAIQSFYLVAPFWDDVDIRFDTGDISYEIHESGYYLDRVNAFIRQKRPTDFEGTWMMVVFYDAVHPFFGLFRPEENTFQAILITDGIYSYTIFTYRCGLMEWDNGATIGFNAAGEIFANHDPSSSLVACLNAPDTDWSNVIFRLSTNSSESPPPSNVEAVNVTLNSTIIRWVVTQIYETQEYMVLYGTDPSNLGNSSGPLSSTDSPDLMFQQILNDLSQGTTYYVQVVATFGIYTLTSDVISFTTLEPAIGSAPENFTAEALGTAVTFTWISPDVDEVIVSFRLICNSDEVVIEIKDINTITLYDLMPETTYYCTLAASSSGGYGPSTEMINVTTGDATEADSYFLFIPMDIHLNVEQLFFPGTDDGFFGPINIPSGLPFGDSVQTDLYIGSNGILSFGSPYNPFLNEELPVPDVVLVAPFWDDVDTRFGSGQISFEIHESGYFLGEVSEFIGRRRSALSFTGTWMLIVYWDAVHPYIGFFSPEENTFQAIVITDGTYSYALFTYNCALMEWDNGVTIGISDGGDFFHTFVPSTSEVACLNLPASNFSNIIYRLSTESPEIPPPHMVAINNITMTEATISWSIQSFIEQEQYFVEYGLSAANLELISDIIQSISDTTINFQPYSVTLQGLTEATKYFFRVVAEFGVGDVYVRSTNIFSFFTQFEPQSAYLQFLSHTDTNIDSDVVLTCDDCSSLEITFPSDFPFGGYYHQSAYVSTNGIITFGSPLFESEPEAFPPDDTDTFWTYIIAPFWADFDTTMGGAASWEIHDREHSSSLMAMVDTFIAEEYGDQNFEGSWMLVAFWENMQPSGQTEGNTFQAILTTNGTKSYAVFTYMCGSLDWTDAATIGYNAPTTDTFTHPLSSSETGPTIRTDEIACLHTASAWSNLIFDLEEDTNHILEMTPEPNFATGSCVQAGYTECCTGFECSVGACFCDDICRFFGDCCYDIDEICPPGDGSVFDILVGHGYHISQVHFEGTSSETVRTNTSGTVVGVDYLYQSSLMFWSDTTTDTIHLANLDGSEEELVVDSCISVVDDIAVDWVSNKLYWTDSSWARIEALDLNSSVRVEVLRTGANTVPRAIAVDPINRAMFWTDYGITAKIETAAMDGRERRTLHFSGLSQPNGITIDYTSGRIYWSDAGQDRLEYSSFDGSERTIVESGTTGLLHPFSVTVGNGVLFWSDWETQKVYATHADHGSSGDEGFFAEIATFLDRPYGIEALRADRQPQAVNPCLASQCSHMCLLTFADETGFACACPEGYEFENETFCKLIEGQTTSCSLTPGSCAAYGSCCEEGFCAGSPATCFCDADCRGRDDCCSDINDTCITGWPRLPRNIQVIDNTGEAVTITWLIPYIESTPETYTVSYGLSSDNLEFSTDPISSGDDTALLDQTYSRTIQDLLYVSTYYFRISVTNDVGTAVSDVLLFTTGEGAPSGPPSNILVVVIGTMVCLSWDPPPENRQNGLIISYLPSFTWDDAIITHRVKGHINSFCIDVRLGDQDITCTVLASTAIGDGPPTDSVTVTTEGVDSGTLPFITLNATYGVDPVVLPESDEGTSEPIALPDYGFPFWSTHQTQAYVAVNGLLSFDTPYGSFFNEQFPGFFTSTRYLVAPFWDDADTRNDGGEISYEVHSSGYLLDHVSAYIRAQRPSEFQGTWMLVVFYDAVQPYLSTGQNSYQVILITDGTFTYTIFTYDCNLMEWGTSATIGFNAGGETFVNNEYTTFAIACSNLPFSNITNVIYRLSENNPEYLLPQDIVALNALTTSVTIQWTVPSVTQQQLYQVLYGVDPVFLDQTSAIVVGAADITLTDQVYSVELSGLDMSTLYYFKVSITFGGLTLMTETSSFRTLDDPPSGPPVNFLASVAGVAVNLMWQSPDVGTGILLSYTLSCSVEGEVVFTAVLKPNPGFILEELNPATTYTCSLSGATSGGDGPSTAITFSTEDIATSGRNLPFITMNTLLDVQETVFDSADEGLDGPFSLDIGFPFGSSNQTDVYVSTNGLLSFGSPYGSYSNQPFPGNFLISLRYLVAPFWEDADTRIGNGQISYEVHQSGYYLDRVNLFLKINRPSTFEGTWMMVVYWSAVRPFSSFSNTEENTYQAILITDGQYSYAIFTYKCGLMEWGPAATIGYSAAGESYANHDPSSFDVACLSIQDSIYTNIIYLLSSESPEIPPPEDVVVDGITTTSATVSWTIPLLVTQEQYYVVYGSDPNDLSQSSDPIPNFEIETNAMYSITLQGLEPGVVYYTQVAAVFNEIFIRYSEVAVFITREPEQTVYLQFLFLPLSRTILDPCDNCASEEIPFPSDLPFGGYFHQSAYVSTNGLISFGRAVTNSNPELFPSSSTFISQSYILAPFWADFNTNIGGSVSWWIEESTQNTGYVSNFIQSEYGDDDFSATWMLVASWDNLQDGNSFQAILITDGTKSYAVYIYSCGQLQWSGPATIGLNTPDDITINHILSGTPIVDNIACIHEDSPWNNLIYDLEMNAVILPETPAPSNFLGSCIASGFTDCCEGFFCLGAPQFDCYCDSGCVFFGDCCSDFEEICEDTSAYDVLVGHGHHISQVHFEGESTETVRTDTTGTVVGVDYFDARGKVFWSDVTTDTIHRANTDGTAEEVLADTNLIAVDDIAVDWVSGKLYWTDAGWARIEAMDMVSLIRIELIRTGSNTIPRAIAVDPTRRVMYWTDWGRTAKIETASMDGNDRRDFVVTDLSQPNGISIDLVSQRVYWSDSDLDKLEFINFDGSSRTPVETEATGLQHPFAVSVAGDILFWSDWETNSIYATHKQHGAEGSLGHFATIATFGSNPYGVEVLLSSRQPSIDDPCENNECSHVCLLSEASLQGFTCACPLGYLLDNDTFCKVTGDTETPTPPEGSCVAAGYEYCCEHGFCAGYPATCFCDSACFELENCCSDVSSICVSGSPRAPMGISVSNIMATSAQIRWTVPFITSTPESYYVIYGFDPSALLMQSPSQTSGANISTVYLQLLTGLDPVEIYYYRVIASNAAGESGSDIYSFMTPDGPPTGPPLNFEVEVDATAMAFKWSPPDPMLQNGDILSYTLSCTATETTSAVTTELQFTIDTFTPGVTFQCSVYATNAFGNGPATFPLPVTTESVQAGATAYLLLLELGLNQVVLPRMVDGTSDAIPLPDVGFPFWSTSRSTVYVGNNGLLSFNTSYDSFFNEAFPGFVSDRYLVAPFWGDVDTTVTGQVLYEVYESEYAIDYVSAFLRRRNPSDFQGTWMMIAYWDRVLPYSFFGTAFEENTFQAILITDGTYSYTIFTYDCNLLEWGTSVTIGFNAGGEMFENNDYTTNAIGCSSLPESNITNIVYRLSSENPEYPTPQDVSVSGITVSTATVSWVVPYTHVQQQYSIVYGEDPDVLDRGWGLLSSSTGTNQQYSLTIQGLMQGTVYYLRVSSTFGYSVLYSDLVSFITLDPPPTGPPLNFFIDVVGTTLELSWQPPAADLQNGVIRYFTLDCTSAGDVTNLQLNSGLSVALDYFRINTNHACTLSSSTSGGPGPSTAASATTDSDVENIYLPLIPVGNVRDVVTSELPALDDTVSDAINIPPFPFGDSIQTRVFVGTNGILSFNSSYNFFGNSPFSESLPDYLVSPFWDDVDISGQNGRILYEIHESGYFLNQVNQFLQRKRPSDFVGTWMLVAHWDAVHPFSFFSTDMENTFQVIVITNGIYSYTIFTYKCGLMEWDDGATIGFKGSGDFYENFDPSSSDVACLNSPESEYSNVIYLLSNESPEIPVPDIVTASATSINSALITWRIPSFVTQEDYYVIYGTDPRNLDGRSDRIQSSSDTTLTNQMFSQTLSGLESGTIYYLRVVAEFDIFRRRQSEIVAFRSPEEEQNYYLEFLEHSDLAGVVDRCSDGCSSPEIILPYDFPFGGYFHETAFVGTNGVITFGNALNDSTPEQFPLSFWSYLVAPFWVNIDTMIVGDVLWELSDDAALLGTVDELIQQEQGDTNFNGLWMLVATWKDVQFIDQQDNAINTFQAILITNGVKSYSVFTYKCDELHRLGPASVGYNAPPTSFYNHPLVTSPLSIEILACAHFESVWNNVIIDLQPGNVILPSIPQPSNPGSCRAAGYTECCDTFFEDCIGLPVVSIPCYCDSLCVLFGDCCFDADHTCNAPTYDLLVGNGNHLSAVHFEGTVSETVRSESSGNVVGVDFHYTRSLMFWSDTVMHTIHQANLDGGNETILVDSNIQAVDDIAVDWIANNLYWVDSVWARIEALNLDTLERTEILRVGANSRPRAIAVDPNNRVMFWTDWGQTAKIEQAFMDGKDRRTLHDTGLSQPNGIAIDYAAQRIYWSDSDLDRLEYSKYDGTERMVLETQADGVLHPFALGVVDDLVFWTDWETNYLYYTHKDHGNTEGLGLFQELAHFTSTPYGVEAIVDRRQQPGENPCAGNDCSHICLLTNNDAGFVCACATGADLQNDDRSCSPTPEPEEGSCAASDYDSCCGHGFCAGYPATCSCSPDCHDLGDCCSDIEDVCPAVLPLVPTDVELTYVTHTTAVIQWRVPTIAFSRETYTLMYSITEDDVNTFMTEPLFSGTDITLTDQTYSSEFPNLSPGTTYYYQIKVENTLGMILTEVFSFETPIVGPPLNFTITVEGSETLTFSWDLPLEIKLADIDYFVIRCEPTFQHAITEIVLDGFSVTLEEFLPGTTYTCTVQAKSDELGAPAVQTATTDEAPTNLPFLVLGTTEGVERITLPASDDATSAPIYITGGLPLGTTTHTIAYVGTNGIISFGERFTFWDPEIFPTDDYYIQTASVTAPFWSDIDTRLAGSVFYETHQRGFNEGSNTVLERVSGFIASTMDINFTASWMLVAQWDRVHPFPHGSTGTETSEVYGNFLESENTFQALVITDGMLNVAVYTYQCGLMGWSGVSDGHYATIGYNLNEVFLNHPLSGTSEAHTIACLSHQAEGDGVSRRQASKWYNQLYQLPTAVDPVQQARSECLTMQILDIQSLGDIQPLSSSLGACPPSAAQAFLDFRFIFHGPSSTINSRCYIYVFSAGSTGLSSLICCYAVQSSVFGALLMGGQDGSSIALYHPYHFSEEHEEFDTSFRDKCCLSGLCDVFHGRRPIDNTIPYIQPFFGFGNGDPHITTLDGTDYTFNGRGEYTLVEVRERGFALQGRTEPVSNTSNATQFSAFAMGIRELDLSAEIRLSQGKLIAFINGENVSSTIEMVNSTTDGGSNAFYLTRTGSNTINMLFYSNPLAYVFSVTQREDILDFVINLDNSLKGNTRGLFGDFNGDPTDDFIRPNGVMVSANASDPILHEFGQSWQITKEESLFTYPMGMGFNDFTFPNHIPPFLDEVVANAPDDIKTMCSDNPQCIFDAVQTNNPEIGVGTLDSIEHNNNDIMVANNFPPSLDGPATLRINIGETAVYTFTAIDEGDTIVVTVEGPVGHSLIPNGNLYTFSWTVTEVFDHPIMFVATDSMDVVSTLSPRVEICGCQNNGNCTLDGILGTVGNTVDMLCECTPGWKGRYCEEDQNGCSELACFEGVQCYDVPAPGSGAICGPCPLGYQGDGEKCADIDECNSTSIDCQQVCINTPGSYMCDCRDGYQLSGTKDCTDVDECQLEIYDCQQVCTNNDGSFTCSCRAGYELAADGITCNALEPCEATSLVCDGECIVISGTATCTCPNGFELAGDGRTCTDINECEADTTPCEDKCMDTEGSFMCGCEGGYTLSSNQRKCEDINECIVSALSGSLPCPEGEICQNTDGGYDCHCPTGTMRNEGVCEVINITEPPVVPIPTDKPSITDDSIGRKNSVNVTLRVRKEQFDMAAQFKFKIEVVSEVTLFCQENSGECGVDRVEITFSDVIILDDNIINNANGQATFLLFVYTKYPTDVLPQKVLQFIVSRLTVVATVEPVIGESDSESSGLSDGAAAAITIVVLLFVAAIVVFAAVLLYRMHKTGVKMPVMSNLRMGDIFTNRHRRSSRLLEEGMDESASVKDTASVSGDVAEETTVGKETKVDLSKEVAEEAL